MVQGQVYSVLNQTNTSVAGLTLFGVLFGQLNALVRLLMAYMLSGRYALALALAYAGESGFSLVDTLAKVSSIGVWLIRVYSGLYAVWSIRYANQNNHWLL